MVQKHLTSEQAIINGSFYTPDHIVKKVYEMLAQFEVEMYIDTSAGYGNFLKKKKNYIGFDIDSHAVKVMKENGYVALENNSLADIDVINKLTKGKVTAIVGNPPYNNFSSLYKKSQKGEFNGNKKYLSRDLGISFLKSYVDINCEYVCVLHPLAYLIKESNFRLLGDFSKQFRIEKSYIFSSNEFLELKNKTPFPIIVALYKRDSRGMSFEDIQKFKFNVEDKLKFSLSSFDFIDKYATKYKDKKITGNYKHFQTMRDINALSRNATWLKSESESSIRVTKDNEYIYKSIVNLKSVYLKHMEKLYFLGNLSPILIDEDYRSRVVTTETKYIEVLKGKKLWMK